MTPLGLSACISQATSTVVPENVSLKITSVLVVRAPCAIVSRVAGQTPEVFDIRLFGCHTESKLSVFTNYGLGWRWKNSHIIGLALKSERLHGRRAAAVAHDPAIDVRLGARVRDGHVLSAVHIEERDRARDRAAAAPGRRQSRGPPT